MVSSYDSARAAGLAAHFVSHSTWQVPTLVLLRYLQTSDESHWVTDARLKYVPVNLQRKWEQDRQAFLSGRSVENLAGWKVFFERNEELVRPFWLGGVRFLAGTDAGPYIFPGSSLHEELALLVQFGLSPMDTIQSATSAAAAFLGKSRELGTVEVGKDADLLLLDADPLADIHNTQKIAGVVLDGKYLSREELDRMLRQVEAAAQRQ